MAESSEYAIGLPQSREVWVVNLHKTQTYRQEYMGQVFEVPPQEEKKLHLEYMDAEGFLSKPDQPQTFDNVGKEIYMGKPLKIVEMNDEERMKFDPRYKAKAKETEMLGKDRCTICGKKMEHPDFLVPHMKAVHPGREPVKEM